MNTVNQCASCPWRVDCEPEYDIPNYDRALHEALGGGVIKEGLRSLRAGVSMACHYSRAGAEHACAGWLHHQLGVGNNFAVRIAVRTGSLPMPEVVGDQHACFEDTLPAPRRPTAVRKGASKRNAGALSGAATKRRARARPRAD